jgi:hypothetical protein
MSVITNTVIAVKATAFGLPSSGSISIEGLNVGDLLIQVVPREFVEGYEQIVSIQDQLKQIKDLDWSPVELTFYFIRGI